MNIFDLPVHPAADAYSMRDSEEMELLVADIQENGLQEPIVIADVEVDGDMVTMLIDGRNRRAACKEAQIEPEVRKLNGQDPFFFVLRSNNRRSPTKASQACSAVIAKMGAEKAFQRNALWGDVAALARASGVLRPVMAKAMTIAAHKADLLAAVVSGAMPFSVAYQKALDAKREADQVNDGMKWLEKTDLKLAQRVREESEQEGGLSLEEATILANDKMEKERAANNNKVQSGMMALKQSTDATCGFAAGDALNEIMELAKEYEYCAETMERYFTKKDLAALKQRAGDYLAGAERIHRFISTLEV